MTKTCFQIYKRSSPILRRSGSLRVPKFPDSSAHVIDKYKLLSNNCTTFVSDVINKTGSSVLNELRIIPTSSFGTYTSFEVKGRFINPRSLLRHLNNQSHKINTHVYKR